MSETAVISREVLLDTAMKLADAAAQTSSEFFRSGVEIDLKSDESPVTIADQRIELAAREMLEAQFPDHAILGEEYGSGDLTNDHVWVIDPIDGTRSFISGHPLYGFLLAHVHRGSCELGMIAMPELGERYVGQKGQGAKLNGRPIATSKTSSLSEAIIYINEGDKLADQEADVLARLLTVGHTRRFGYDCYPHALLASGHVDLVIDYDLKAFDYLPLAGVIEEAGGVITDWQGNPLSYASDGRVVSAATAQLHREAIALLINGGPLQ